MRLTLHAVRTLLFARRNPYLLSNLVGAVLALVSIPLVLLHLPDPKAAELGSLP